VGQLLGGDSGSRIWTRLREAEGLSYGAGAWTYAGEADDGGGFGASAIVAPQNLAKAKAALLDEITKLAAGPITAAELQRGKDSWRKAQDTNLANDTNVIELLANQTFRGRTTQFSVDLRAKIAALTPADVERVATQYLHPKRLIIVDAGTPAPLKGGPAGASRR
jgi:zinc protease